MLILTQTLTLIPTLALTLTQTEEKHYFASRGKIATSINISIQSAQQCQYELEGFISPEIFM